MAAVGVPVFVGVAEGVGTSGMEVGEKTGPGGGVKVATGRRVERGMGAEVAAWGFAGGPERGRPAG